MKRTEVLIGGTPGTGKSFVTKQIASERGMNWISTDLIRSVMKETVDRSQNPELFVYENTTPEDYLKNHSINEMVEDQEKQGKAVWKGVEGLIKSRNAWDSYIVEGVAILPESVHRSFPDRESMKTVFIANSNKDDLERVVYSRGLWTAAEKYSNELKEIEVKWLLAFNEWLVSEAERYGFPTVRNMSGEKLYNEVVKNI